MTDRRICTSRRLCVSDGIQALLNLKRLIRIGKLAEKALQEINETGRTSGPVPTLTPPSKKRPSVVVKETFLTYVDPVRESIPGYGSHRLSFPDLKMKQTKGRPIPIFTVVIPGAGMTWADGAWIPVGDLGTERLGSARVLKDGGVSFFFSNRITDKDGGLAHTVHPPSDPRFMGSAKRMADAAARYIMGSRIGPVRHTEYHDKLSEWLVEDGHVAAWNLQILGYADVVRTMLT